MSDYLTSRTGDSAFAELLLRLADAWPELAADDQFIARRLIAGWATPTA